MFRHLIKNLSKTATEINYHFWNVYKSNYHEKHKSELDISDFRSFEQDLLKSPEVKFVQVTIILTILSHNECSLNWAIKMRRITSKGLNLITFMDVHGRPWTRPPLIAFKKFLLAIILLNLGRNFTKCLIKYGMKVSLLQ